MPTEAQLARDVIHDVRAACERNGRAATEAEVALALEGLTEAQLRGVSRVSREPSPHPIGLHALIDLASGVSREVAQARELSGYYEMKAERDALAIQVQAVSPLAAPSPRPALPSALKELPAKAKRVVSPAVIDPTAVEKQALMTLFAYHRDAVRVAQELSIGTFELTARIEVLGLRRSIHRLLESTTDVDNFVPGRIGVPRTRGVAPPVVRRRAAPEVTPAPEEVEAAPEVEEEVEEEPAADGPVVLTARREYVREVRRRKKISRPIEMPRLVPPPPQLPRLKPFSDLQAPGGEGVLNRLLADEKANPRALVAKLAEKYDGPGRPLNESDLRSLLKHHGLADTFHEREVANTRFLIGFHQGAKAKLGNALQMTPQELAPYLTRIGLLNDLERTRAERANIELGRKRIHDRITQVLTRAPYMDDLGVLPVIDREVRDYLKAELDLGKASAAVRAELKMEPLPFSKLLRRYGFEP